MPRIPNTTIQFLNVPWDSGYRNLRYFTSNANRDLWFDNRSHFTYPTDGVGEVTHAQPVKVGVEYTVNHNFERLYRYNYCRFKNSGYDNNDGWIYGFITGWRWSSEHSATFTFIRDAWINNIDNFIFPTQFIERETTDTVNDLPEPINVHRYVSEGVHEIFRGGTSLLYVVVYSETDTSGSIGESNIDNINYPLSFLISDNYSTFKADITAIVQRGQSSNIVTCFVVPQGYVTHSSRTSMIFNPQTGQATRTWGSYTPKHGKTKRYPFCYCMFTDWFGNQQIVKWEDGNGDHIDLKLTGSVGLNGFISLDFRDTNAGLTGRQTITHNVTAPIGFTADGTANWLAQNSTNLQAMGARTALSLANQAADAFSNPLGIVSSFGGSLLKSAVNMEMTIADNEISKNVMIANAEYVPNNTQAPTGSIQGMLAQNKLGFCYFSMHASDTELKFIDDFFDKYGYNVSRLKNISFDFIDGHYYVKTGNAVVRGNAPQEDRNTMMTVLDRGVTFWDKDAIGEY